MICYVCHRLKAEGRIARAKTSTMVVNGYSVCNRHAWSPTNTEAILRAIEQERAAMRRWFTEAVELHGEFSEKRQKFADGDTLTGAEWPWDDGSDSPQ